MSWVFSRLIPISLLLASSWCGLFVWWKIRSLMPWALLIKLLHLLLQVHKSWIFYFWFVSFNALNWILLPVNICCHLLSLECVPRIHIFTIVQTHLFIELLFKLIKLAWFFSFSRGFMKVLILLLSMFDLSVVYFEHLLIKIFFVIFRWWYFLCKNLNWHSLILSFLTSIIIGLP